MKILRTCIVLCFWSWEGFKILKIIFFRFLFHCNTFQICDTFTHWCQWDLNISTERKIWFLGIFCLHSLYVSYIGGWYLVPVTNHHVFESISPHNRHNYPDQCVDDHHHPDITGQS